MPKFPLDVMSLPSEKFLLELSWGPEIIETGVPTTFVMNIQRSYYRRLNQGIVV